MVAASTEAIVGFALGVQVKKLLTGPAKAVVDYHTTHFKLLARAMKEAKRDGEIKKTIKEMEANLRKLTDAGDTLLRNIPAKPEAPELKLENWGNRQKVKDFEQACKLFAKGTKVVLQHVGEYQKKTDDCMKKTKKQIKEVEAQLVLTGSNFSAMRQIAIRTRADDLLMIQFDWMPELKKRMNQAKKLHAAYNRIG